MCSEIIAATAAFNIITIAEIAPTGSAVDGILWFFNACGFLFEMLIALAMFVWRLERKRHFAIRFTCSAAVMIVIAIAWAKFIPSNAWTLIARCTLFYAMCYITLLVCMELNARQALFYLVAGVATQHLAYCAALIVVMLVNPGNYSIGTSISSLIYPLALIPCFAIAYWLFARPLAHTVPDSSLSSHMLLLFIGVLLCVNVFACLFDGFVAGQQLPYLAYMMCVLTRLVTCSFLLMLLREIVERSQAERDGAVLQQLLNQQKSQMARDKETINLINVKTHDLKKQLTSLGNRIGKDEITGLNNLVDIYDSSVRTGNETLDILLAQKSLICEQRGISFERLIDGHAIDFMKPADIYALFGNAMDNALEALSRLDPSDKTTPRTIRMQVKHDKGMTVIHIANPYQGILTFDHDLPVTTKSDSRYHGFGMRSIQLVVEHYHGALSIETQHQWFSLNIVLSGE